MRFFYVHKFAAGEKSIYLWYRSNVKIKINCYDWHHYRLIYSFFILIIKSSCAKLIAEKRLPFVQRKFNHRIERKNLHSIRMESSLRISMSPSLTPKWKSNGGIMVCTVDLTVLSFRSRFWEFDMFHEQSKC